MWTKTAFLGLVSTAILIICAPFVLADWQGQNSCVAGTPCSIQHALINGSELVNGSSCNLTIRNQTNLLIQEGIMTDLGAGYYNYSFTPNNTGIYPSNAHCLLSANTVFADKTFIADKQGSKFMGFEVAITTFFSGLTFLLTWLAFSSNKQPRNFGRISYEHALWLSVTLSIYLGITFLTHIVAYENTTSNASLTAMTNILNVLFANQTWILVFIFSMAMMSFIIRSVLYFKEIKKRAQEVHNQAQEDFEIL